jgi:hypothetical protein
MVLASRDGSPQDFNQTDGRDGDVYPGVRQFGVMPLSALCEVQ